MAYGPALMRRLSELRKASGLSPDKLAKKIGLSRATWFNKQNGTFEITVEEAEAAAAALKAQFQVILDGKDVLSGAAASVSAQNNEHGGAPMNEHVATLVGLLSQLEEPQQEKVLRVVESTMSAMGFGGPGASRGPSRTRGKSNSGPRT